MPPKRKLSMDDVANSPAVPKREPLSPIKQLMFAPLPPASNPISYKTPDSKERRISYQSTPTGTPKHKKRTQSHIIAGNKNSLIIQPPLDYDGSDMDFVGKLFADQEMYEKEQNIIEKLSEVDAQNRYLIFATQPAKSFGYSDKSLQQVMTQQSSFQDHLSQNIETWIRKGRRYGETRYRDYYPVWQMSMPFGGTPLDKLESPIDFMQWIQYALQISAGVQRLQEANLVHQDLVPRNVVISPTDKHARIIDFGVTISAEHVFDMEENEDRLETVYVAYPPEYHCTYTQNVSNYWNSLRPVRRAFMKLHGFSTKADVASKYATIHSKNPKKVDVYSLGILLLTMMHEKKIGAIPDEKKQAWMNLLKGMTTMNPNQRWTIGKVIRQLEAILGQRATMSPPYVPDGNNIVSPYKSMDSRRIRSQS